jgi:hypothetical protein
VLAAPGAGTSLVRASGPGLATRTVIPLPGPPTLVGINSLEPCGVAASSADHVIVCMTPQGGYDDELVIARLLDTASPQFAYASNAPAFSALTVFPYSGIVAVDSAASGVSVALAGREPEPDPCAADPCAQGCNPCTCDPCMCDPCMCDPCSCGMCHLRALAAPDARRAAALAARRAALLAAPAARRRLVTGDGGTILLLDPSP